MLFLGHVIPQMPYLSKSTLIYSCSIEYFPTKVIIVIKIQ